MNTDAGLRRIQIELLPDGEPTLNYTWLEQELGRSLSVQELHWLIRWQGWHLGLEVSWLAFESGVAFNILHSLSVISRLEHIVRADQLWVDSSKLNLGLYLLLADHGSLVRAVVSVRIFNPVISKLLHLSLMQVTDQMIMISPDILVAGSITWMSVLLNRDERRGRLSIQRSIHKGPQWVSPSIVISPGS